MSDPLTIAVSALTLACVGLIFVGLILITQNHRMHAAVLIALEGFGHTHLLGFEALKIDLDRLKARVDELDMR